VLQLRAYARPEQVDALAARLGGLAGVRHLVAGGRTSGGMTQLTGEVDSVAADDVLDVLKTFDLAADDVTLWRVPSVQPLGWRRRRGRMTRDAAVWSEVAGRADENARPRLNFVLYMFTAGVIAGAGVLTGSSILVVGAMAISPDLLPMASAAVGLVEKRPAQVARAMVTLAIGMTIVVGAAALSTLLLRLDGRIAADLDLAGGVLGPSLTSIGPGTVLVALAAGMAGMLAYETAGSAAVGVAISVTTVPAAAYLGDALALQGFQKGLGSLEVLLVNVAGVVAAATLTLLGQRRLRRLAGRR
jgi:uncharacterized hydrophobic protein (TIGR00271 family)